MKNIAYCFVAFFLMSADCYKKEGPNCHHDIIIRNLSSNKVIYAFKSFYDPRRVDDSCFLFLDGTEIAAGGELKRGNRPCWEDELKNGATFDFLIVDPGLFNFNAPNRYYRCDSLYIKNRILKEYSVTLEELKADNFVVTYE